MKSLLQEGPKQILFVVVLPQAFKMKRDEFENCAHYGKATCKRLFAKTPWKQGLEVK